MVHPATFNTRHDRSLFDDEMDVGTTDAKRADAGAPWSATGRFPFRESGIHVEWATREVDRRVWCFEIHARRDLPILKREYCLDEARRTGSGVEMPDIGFDGADRAELLPLGPRAKGLGQRRDLDRIPQCGASTVCFYISNRVWADARPLLG